MNEAEFISLEIALRRRVAAGDASLKTLNLFVRKT
jgi:hypothetical protein